MLATDVYLGAWLMNEGAELKGVKVSRSNGRTTAVFELDGPAIEENAAAFYGEQAVVNLAAYRRHLEALKDELFDAIRRNGSREGTENERRTDDAHHHARNHRFARR